MSVLVAICGKKCVSLAKMFRKCFADVSQNPPNYDNLQILHRQADD